MEKEKKFFYEVNEFKEYITKLIALEYGENLSYDELLKLKSMNNLESLKPRQKTHYVNNCNYFINNFSDKDAIDYVLTLSMLYNKGDFIDKYNDENIQIILLEVFNRITIDKYDDYIKFVDNTKCINNLRIRVEDINQDQEFERKIVIVRDIVSQFINYLNSNKDLESVSKDEINKAIKGFKPKGVANYVTESINDNPIKR